MKFFILLSAMSLFLTGCLLTREDVQEVEERRAVKEQVSSLAKNKADLQVQIDNLSDENRRLLGRVETLEHKLQILVEAAKSEKAGERKNLDDVVQQMKVFDENVGDINKKIMALDEKINNVATHAAKAAVEGGDAKPAVGGDGKKKDAYWLEGEEQFDKKNWKKAAAAFAKYRELNPKGSHWPAATYKIGVCFQEMGMKGEAAAFFEEVIEKFPKDPMAKKATFRLNQLKK